MDTTVIRDRIKICSDRLTQANTDALMEQNQAMQDFLIWLDGYLTGYDEES